MKENTMKKGFVLCALALLAVAPAFGGYAVNKSVCNQALVNKGACAAGQIGTLVTTTGRSSIHLSMLNADLVNLRDSLCPVPPAGETQNDCVDRIIRERVAALVAAKVVDDACSTADPQPDVE